MKLLKKNLEIAIDGFSGCGKSSLAFLLTKKLCLAYIYTGAMYRTVAHLALEKNIALDDEEKILKLLKKCKLELKKPSQPDRYTDVYLNKINVTSYLFSPQVNSAAAEVAKLRSIRQYLVGLQKKLAQGKAVVMEGRDIGTVVLPEADLKIFLTAALKTRVQRRLRQLNEIGKPRPFKDVLKEIKKRDWEDIHRKESPFKKAPDSWVLDTTNLTIPETVALVLAKLKEKELIK